MFVEQWLQSINFGFVIRFIPLQVYWPQSLRRTRMYHQICWQMRKTMFKLSCYDWFQGLLLNPLSITQVLLYYKAPGYVWEYMSWCITMMLDQFLVRLLIFFVWRIRLCFVFMTIMVTSLLCLHTRSTKLSFASCLIFQVFTKGPSLRIWVG